MLQIHPMATEREQYERGGYTYMRRKKVLALLITTAMVTGTLAGCGNSNEKVQGTQPTDSAQESSTTTAANEPQTSEPAKGEFTYPMDNSTTLTLGILPLDRNGRKRPE